MSFAHLGEIYKGQKVTEEWLNATGNYYLKPAERQTYWKIVVDASTDTEAYLKKALTKAIKKLKKIISNKILRCKLRPAAHQHIKACLL